MDVSLDVDDALARLSELHYDLVISDMGRPSNNQAGYQLLHTIRASRNEVPFVIYAGSDLPAHHIEAHRRGAQGSHE